MIKILLLEDEDKLRLALTRGLTEQGYEVVASGDGCQGLALATTDSFDCLLLDRMLPGLDGLEILQKLRAARILVPTIILTARGDIEDRVEGLDSGADDYLCKPFSWDELLARIRACLRRIETAEWSTLRCGDITLDCSRRRLICAEREIEMTVRQCELLEYLMRHQGRIVSREEVACHVWDEQLTSLTNVVDVYVSYVRKHLSLLNSRTTIQTIRGVGYRLGVPS